MHTLWCSFSQISVIPVYCFEGSWGKSKCNFLIRAIEMLPFFIILQWDISNHHLDIYWPRSMVPYGVTRSQWSDAESSAKSRKIFLAILVFVIWSGKWIWNLWILNLLIAEKKLWRKKIMLWQSEICLLMAEQCQMQGHPQVQTYL